VISSNLKIFLGGGKKLFALTVWFVWLFRHLIRAEYYGNKRLKELTLNVSRRSSNLPLLSGMIFLLSFLRIPLLVSRMTVFYKERF
jgi:UDP-N-acetylmuramyl pentapeptide phosphotransferase/UDP-N-acetylglucosamine-1-phosphate transferase